MNTPIAVLTHMTGYMIQDAKQTIEAVGAAPDPFAESERVAAYVLLLQVREWLAAPSIEQATPYQGQEFDGVGAQALQEHVAMFSCLSSREQYETVVQLGQLLQSTHDDYQCGNGLDGLDRPAATAYFLVPRMSVLLHTFLLPLLVMIGLLFGTPDAQANDEPAFLASQVIERWTAAALTTIQKGDRVAVGPITWPTESKALMGTYRDRRAMQGALGARLERAGVRVVSEHDTYDVLLWGGAWDGITRSRAYLLKTDPMGRTTMAAPVNLIAPVWGDERPYGAWQPHLERFATQIAEAFVATKRPRITLNPHAADLDGQVITGATESVHHALLPLLIEALTGHGIEVYLPTPSSPTVQLQVGVEWPTMTVMGRHPEDARDVVHGATVHAWTIAHRGATTLMAGPLTLALSWPSGARTVAKADQLQALLMELPWQWTIEGAKILADERSWHAQTQAWWAENARQHQKKTTGMLTGSLARITAEHQRATQELKQAWKNSPTQSVPKEIEENSAKLERHLHPLADSLERQRLRGETYDRPYPRG
ncbi:hypothetical protein [Nitrospira defluvii]|uniref:Uncharacterized protein n=1 Tax=Nitrospira defluvii TaxID=330214 RepID=A0ABN7M266_9BACT|nr:hypothetical protein [Nitrospira defluvii]CAE6779291.1 conserved hypothetical protein [Nitrospira defluvii]